MIIQNTLPCKRAINQTSWDYAELSKRASKVGGPQQLIDLLIEYGRKSGRKEMVPIICIACGASVVCCLGIIKLINHIQGKQEAPQEEKEENMSRYAMCPVCNHRMKRVYDSMGVWDGMTYECEYCSQDSSDEYDDEGMSVYEAAEIWASHGKDEEYTFGFSINELEEAL